MLPKWNKIIITLSSDRLLKSDVWRFKILDGYFDYNNAYLFIQHVYRKTRGDSLKMLNAYLKSNGQKRKTENISII